MPLDFVCSRCASRQGAEATCASCGNDIVHDLRDPRTIDLLRDVHRRHAEARRRKSVGMGAAAGIVGSAVTSPIWWPIIIRTPVHYVKALPIAICVAIGLGLIELLDRAWVRKTHLRDLWDEGEET